MTKKEFMNSICNGKEDIVQQVIELLNSIEADYCVIGGLAVNAYVDPVVSLDLDIVVVMDLIDKFIKEAEKKFKIEKFPHSINISSSKSDLRIQIQTDKRYQPFIQKASTKDVMGYNMKIASLEDILKGKVWAYSDEQRRKSKRQKDLADIYRIIETYPELKDLLPEEIKNKEF